MERTVNKQILREWAKGKQKPQFELAYKANVSTGTVSKVFNGACPSLEATREKIALAIGVDVSVLFPIVESDQAA